MSSSKLVDHAPSVRHQEEVCSVSKSLATPYNNVDEVPPFFGILFTLTAARDISIQTFELDVRLEAAGNDLAIEVYTISGDYTGIGDGVNYKNESSLWTPVAQTNGVVLPNGNGIIIPSTNFTPVQMKAYSRQSFYVTMGGPYIDSTVYGLSKTGDVYAQGADLNVLVGSGLSGYKFPAEIDPIVDPQFTGVIHYKKFGNCNSLVTSTKVEYLFLANSNRTEVDVSHVVDQALRNYLADNGVFGGFVIKYGVSEQGKASTDHPQFTGTCPPEWSGCPSSLVRTTVSFAHQDALESAILLYELYGASVAITSAVEKEVGGVEVAYVGLNSLSSGFEISLQGISYGQTMDESTLRYFADATESFLSSIVDPALASNFGIMVSSQEFRSPTRHIRGLQGTGTLWVTGQIHAIRYAIFDASQLDLTLQNAFNSGAKNFIDTLTKGSILPGAINAEDRSAYFANVTGIYSTVDNAVLYAPGSEPTATSAPAGPNITAIAVAVGVIGGVALLVAFTFLRRFWKVQFDARKHLLEYRAGRKDEAAKQRHAALVENVSSRAPSGRSNLDDEAPPLSRMSSAADMCTISTKDDLFLEDGGESSSSSQTSGLNDTSSRDPPQRTRSKEMDLHAAVHRIQRKSLEKNAGASVGAGAELSRGFHHDGTSGLSSFIDRQSRGIIHNGAKSVGPGVLIHAERAVRAPAVESSELPRPPSGRKLRSKSFVDAEESQETSSIKVGYFSSIGSHRGAIRSRSFDDASAYTGANLMPWTEHIIKEPKQVQRLNEAHLAGHMPVVSKAKPDQSAQLSRRPSGHQNGDASLSGFPGTHPTIRSSIERQSVDPCLLSNTRGERRARAEPPRQLRPRTRSFDDTRDYASSDDSVNPGTSLSGFLVSSPVVKSSMVAQSVDPRLLMNFRGERRNQSDPYRRQPRRRTRSFDDTRDYTEMDECRSVDPRMFTVERSERPVAPIGQTSRPRRSHSFDDTKEYQSLDLPFESPRQPSRSCSIAAKGVNAKVKKDPDRRGRSRSFDDTKDYALEKEERSLTPIRRVVRSRSFDDATMYAKATPQIPLASERPIIREGHQSSGTKLSGFMNGNSLNNSQSRQQNNVKRSSGIVSQPGY